MYGETPPVAETVKSVVPPLQSMIAEEAIDTMIAAGSITVCVTSAVHPFASVTVYVYVPAPTLKTPVPV